MGAYLTVYSSIARADCDECAFMLGAVAIPSAVAFDGEYFPLGVDDSDAVAASVHLDRYASELGVGAPLSGAATPQLRSHAHA